MPAGGTSDAFVMAYLQPPPNNSMQSSFPHSGNDGASLVAEPNRQTTDLQLQQAGPTDVSLTAPEQAAMDNAEEHSVHVQCWGAGLSGEEV